MAKKAIAGWSDERLRRLFDRYNQRFFSGRLSDWTVDSSENHLGHYGYCNPETKRISIRVEAHRNDRQVRATLVHEMAHAVTDVDHNAEWQSEMARLKSAGAPTEPLDFVVPYESRSLVTSFMDYASGGASWQEALNDLGEGIPEDTLRECKRLFDIAKRKRKV